MNSKHIIAFTFIYCFLMLSCTNNNSQATKEEMQTVNFKINNEYKALIENFIRTNNVPKNWIIQFQVRNDNTIFLTSTGGFCFEKHFNIQAVQYLENHYIVFDLKSPFMENIRLNFTPNCNTIYDGNFWLIENDTTPFKIHKIY